MELKQITNLPDNYTPIPNYFMNNITIKKISKNKKAKLIFKSSKLKNQQSKKIAVKIKFWTKIVSKRQVFMDQYQVMQVIWKVMFRFLKIKMRISETL